MGDFGFEEALGTVGILYRDTEYTQCATGTARRRAYDALECFRSTSSAQSVDVLVGGTSLPAVTVAATATGPSNTTNTTNTTTTTTSTTSTTTTGTVPSCCSSVAPALDISNVSCDIDADVSRHVFYDFARADNHPRIGVCARPKSLEWKSFLELDRVVPVRFVPAELSAVYTLDWSDPDGGGEHGLDLHCRLEPVESVSKLELDYDVVRRQLESALEVGPTLRSTVCRVEARQDALRKVTVKKTHETGWGVGGSVSSVTYSHDGKVKAELFKRKRAKDEPHEGSGASNATTRVSSLLSSLLSSLPTVSVTRAGGRVKECGVKQWVCGGRVDVHATLKRSDGDDAVRVGVGAPRFELEAQGVVRGVPVPVSVRSVRSFKVKTKGRLASEVCYGEGGVKVGGKIKGLGGGGKVRVEVEYQQAQNFLATRFGFWFPL